MFPEVLIINLQYKLYPRQRRLYTQGERILKVYTRGHVDVSSQGLHCTWAVFGSEGCAPFSVTRVKARIKILRRKFVTLVRL